MIGVVLAASLWGVGLGGYALPNRHVTPGETVEISVKTLCATKWGKDVRHVTQTMKVEVCQRYGATGKCPGPGYEIDHLVSRELGGADTIANLWPQPITEARKKDVLENFLHHAVCTGAMTLPEAQDAIRIDWTKAYWKMKDG
jgi:hypothetical protein